MPASRTAWRVGAKPSHAPGPPKLGARVHWLCVAMSTPCIGWARNWAIGHFAALPRSVQLALPCWGTGNNRPMKAWHMPPDIGSATSHTAHVRMHCGMPAPKPLDKRQAQRHPNPCQTACPTFCPKTSHTQSPPVGGSTWLRWTGHPPITGRKPTVPSNYPICWPSWSRPCASNSAGPCMLLKRGCGLTHCSHSPQVNSCGACGNA